jgi:hypothetical protein
MAQTRDLQVSMICYEMSYLQGSGKLSTSKMSGISLRTFTQAFSLEPIRL